MRIRLTPRFKNFRARLQGWLLHDAEKHGGLRKVGRKLRAAQTRLRARLPRNLSRIDLRKIEWKKITEHSNAIRWVLILVGVYLGAQLASQIIGLFIRPTYMPLPKRVATAPPSPRISEDYEAILKRNMFNVEGEIPNPFDQGLLDCLSQAKPSTQRLTLLGTIVMNEDRFSVALLQEEGNATKIAVRKDDLFLDRYVALKVDRKKLCFQVRSTQELEYIEIPEENLGLLGGPSISSPGSSGGISVLSETEREISRQTFDAKLANLNEILQTAKAVPHTDPVTGKRGFLIQSIDAGSIFAELGFQRGDFMSRVNEIELDNPGKALEAFQKLRSSNRVGIAITRNGQNMTLNYSVR